MIIPSNIVRQLHDLNCEEVAIRFDLNPKRHMCHCFKHEDHHASLGFKGNHWKCFSCDIGGDAITLAQELYSLSFTDACLLLAKEFNIDIPNIPKKSEMWKKSVIQLRRTNTVSLVENMFDKEVASFIMNYTRLSDAGKSFLFGLRKLNERVVADLNIHSLDDQRELKSLLEKNFNTDRLIKVKVLKENRKFLTIDPPSLIIPYYDENNNLISLQTRYLGEDNINFHIPRFKRICGSHIRMFNLPVLKKLQAGERLFITEGITDCLAMLSAGYNAVALPSATSFPSEDLAKLRKYDLYMVADQDRAGNEAFLKLYRMMLRYGRELKRVELSRDIKDFSEYYLKTII